jgi:hypothetical protein
MDGPLTLAPIGLTVSVQFFSQNLHGPPIHIVLLSNLETVMHPRDLFALVVVDMNPFVYAIV